MNSKAKAILRRYPLCSHCLERLIRPKLKYPLDTKECYICGGFFKRLDDIIKTVSRALGEYEFRSFNIGLSTPKEWIEKEDLIRSEFKLQGGRSIKADISHTLSSTLSKILEKPVNHLNPDLVAVVDVLSGGVVVDAKPVYLFGRYTKTKRGLPQKQVRCEVCRGRGCPECEFTGRGKGLTVEQLLSQHILDTLKGSKTTFSWCGGEDKQSLVLGGGRPFYVEVHNPKRRSLQHMDLPANVGHGVKIAQLTLLDGKPQKMPRFRSKVLARILFQSRPDRKKLSEIPTILERSEIHQASLKKRKTYVKRIYSFEIRVFGLKGFVRFECDGGLSIRRFLTGVGEPLTPNLPSLLGVNVELDEEKPFDILDVTLEGF